jgi:hypothetical protein
MNLSPCSPPQSEDGRVTVPERDCARRISRSQLARSGALGLFRTPLTGRTLLRTGLRHRRGPMALAAVNEVEDGVSQPESRLICMYGAGQSPRGRDDGTSTTLRAVG